jgi:hypothetical protein
MRSEITDLCHVSFLCTPTSIILLGLSVDEICFCSAQKPSKLWKIPLSVGLVRHPVTGSCTSRFCLGFCCLNDVNLDSVSLVVYLFVAYLTFSVAQILWRREGTRTEGGENRAFCNVTTTAVIIMH